MQAVRRVAGSARFRQTDCPSDVEVRSMSGFPSVDHGLRQLLVYGLSAVPVLLSLGNGQNMTALKQKMPWALPISTDLNLLQGARPWQLGSLPDLATEFCPLDAADMQLAKALDKIVRQRIIFESVLDCDGTGSSSLLGCYTHDICIGRGDRANVSNPRKIDSGINAFFMASHRLWCFRLMTAASAPLME